MTRRIAYRMPGPVAVVAAALALLAATAGWIAGSAHATMSETDAIEAVAAEWVAQGGARTDCAAVPGEGAVWLIVRCGNSGDALVRQLDRRGRLLEGAET